MRTDVAYLRRLDDELRDLPRARREEILTEIREHITEADPVTEAELREVLDRLGEPEDIAADARERFGISGRRGMGLRETFALILLPIGGLIFPVIGWIIGVALLWGSRAWTTQQKWVGTLVFPGGLALPMLIVFSSGYSCYDSGDGRGEICPGAPSDVERWLTIGGVMVLALGSIFTVIYLAGRARRPAANAPH